MHEFRNLCKYGQFSVHKVMRCQLKRLLRYGVMSVIGLYVTHTLLLTDLVLKNERTHTLLVMDHVLTQERTHNTSEIHFTMTRQGVKNSNNLIKGNTGLNNSRTDQNIQGGAMCDRNNTNTTKSVKDSNIINNLPVNTTVNSSKDERKGDFLSDTRNTRNKTVGVTVDTGKDDKMDLKTDISNLEVFQKKQTPRVDASVYTNISTKVVKHKASDTNNSQAGIAEMQSGNDFHIKSGKQNLFRKWDFNCSSDEGITAAKFEVDLDERSFFQLEALFAHTNISVGGGWNPGQADGSQGPAPKCPHCHTQRLAVVIPVRDREGHLKVLLQNLVNFLQTQRRDFRIFVVEQFGEEVFNKASLINIGYREALKRAQFDCFIFHDVDLIPTNLCNMYQCEEQPRHLAVAVNTLEYKLIYPTLFGGVVGMNSHTMKQINGFSNIFYGWGGEDDESYSRLVTEGFTILRHPDAVGEYLMLEHDKYAGFPKSRRDLAISHLNARYLKYDGLSSLHYSVLDTMQGALFTRFKVSLTPGPHDILESNAFFTCKQEQFEKYIVRDEKIANLRDQLKDSGLLAGKAGAILQNIQSVRSMAISASCQETMLYNRRHGILPANVSDLELDSARMGVRVIKGTPRPGVIRKEKKQIHRSQLKKHG